MLKFLAFSSLVLSFFAFVSAYESARQYLWTVTLPATRSHRLLDGLRKPAKNALLKVSLQRVSIRIKPSLEWVP